MNEMIFAHTYLYTAISVACLNVCSFYCVWMLLFLFLLFTVSAVVISVGNIMKDERDSHMKSMVDIFSLEISGFGRKLRLLQFFPLKNLTMGKNHVSIFVPWVLCPHLRRNAVLQLLSPTGGFLFALFNALPPEVN